MADDTSLANLALQSFGSRVTLTAAQLAAGSNNEAKQVNLAFANCRDSLLRMAPWDCGMKTANLTYITSVPGTPENTSPATTLWTPGQPRPPWAYEYQYPVDCLKACWIIPATQTGYAGGVPITTAVTGGAPTLWNGAPIRFKLGIDDFYPVISATVASGGVGYSPGDLITLISTVVGDVPIGAPVVLRVLTAPAGVVATVSIVNQVLGSSTAVGGSYFLPQLSPVAQGSITTESITYGAGQGSGATFNLGFGPKTNQRVILTNQEFATLVYVRQVTDSNVWDPMFQDAFTDFLGGTICYALTGDKKLANLRIAAANQTIAAARIADANEGLTINDVTPDWIRGRGYSGPDSMISGPYASFDWGGMISPW